MTINTIIYPIHYTFFSERSVNIRNTANFRSINFKTRPFFKALSISSFFGKIAHASMDKGHLSRSFNPCKSIFIHDRCTFVHSATVVPLTFTNPPPFSPFRFIPFICPLFPSPSICLCFRIEYSHS